MEKCYPRDVAEQFIHERNKALETRVLQVARGRRASHFKVKSAVEPLAELTVHHKPDGDFTMAVGIPAKSIVFCRWDRSPHRRPHKCDESGSDILAGHKHYYEANVAGPQRRVNRGEVHIPTVTLEEAVKAFCEEVHILPPEKVQSEPMRVGLG